VRYSKTCKQVFWTLVLASCITGCGYQFVGDSSLLPKDAHTIYVELFRELDLARRERQALVDVQSRLAAINQDLDGALVEALGSSFDFIRAGGK